MCPVFCFLWCLWCKYLKLQRWVVGWWVSDELQRVSKEVLPQLKHCPSIRLEGRWKPRKPSIGIIGVPAEIRTDTYRIQSYHYTNLFHILLCGTCVNIYSVLLLRMQNEIRQGRSDKWMHRIFVITTMLCNSNYYCVSWRSHVTASVYITIIVAASLRLIQSLQTNSKTLSQIRTQPLRSKSLHTHYSRNFPF
jgi:hypothetical protein